MTKLFDVRKIIKTSLPSFPDVEIEIYDGLLTHQFEKINDMEKDYDRGMETLRYLIKSWSFTDENEKPLEISKFNLGNLPAKDFTFLMEKVGNVMNDSLLKKGKSSKK